MERALNNLIGNGLRFCHSQLRISLTSDAAHIACLQVEDDGPGIAPENRESVLNRLFVWKQALRTAAADVGWGWRLFMLSRVLTKAILRWMKARSAVPVSAFAGQ